MILGISTTSFTLSHMLFALTGIGSGFVVLVGLLHSKRHSGWTWIYFSSSMLTSLTGFAFPFERLLYSHVLGLLSLLVLTIALFARTVYNFEGAWRWIYVITIAMALYFNCVAAVVQLFAKIPALRAMAPRYREPLFIIAQLAVLATFIVLTFQATQKFRDETSLAG